MPQVQLVDTTQKPYEPQGIDRLFSQLGRDYKDQKDRQEISKLLSEYEQNMQDQNAYQKLQLGLEKSTISPSRRIQAQESLNAMQKVITERDKVLNAQAAASKGYDIQSTLDALDELEDLIPQSGIGFLGQISQTKKAVYNKGKFSSLQTKLLPLFKSFFPRGMTEKEFKFIQENYIPQYSDREEKIRGKIEGLRSLAKGNSSIDLEGTQKEKKPERPPLSSFRK